MEASRIQRSGKSLSLSALVSLVLMAAMTACSGSEQSSATAGATDATSDPTASPAFSPSASPTITPPGQQAVDRAARQVDDFVVLWAEQGWDAAGSRHLWRFKPVGSSPVGPLRQGRVVSHELRSWQGPQHFELLVSLDLEFEGSPGMWQQGSNDIFVTVRPGQPGPFRLDLNSGPAGAG